LIGELLNRRQYEQAATLIREIQPTFTDKSVRESLASKLEQISGNGAVSEPMEAQAAGAKAKLSLVFRNAAKVDLVARKVDVPQLLADVQAYLKSKPAGRRVGRRVNVQAVGQRLMKQDGGKYLSKPVAEWSQDLQPAPSTGTSAQALRRP